MTELAYATALSVEQAIGAEIGHFLDRFLERIHDCPRWSALVVVGQKPVQVAQYIHAKPEGHFLDSRERQVISEARQHSSSLIAKKDQDRSQKE